MADQAQRVAQVEGPKTEDPGALRPKIVENSNLARLKEEIENANSLDTLQYAIRPKEIKRHFGVGLGEIDRLVVEARDRLNRPVDQPDIVLDAWVGPVSGTKIPTETAEFLKTYLVIADDDLKLIATYCLYTHSVVIFDNAPKLFVSAVEEGCGKSTLVEIMEGLVYKPIKYDYITLAALIRELDKKTVTFVLDEADKYMIDGKGYHNSLNSTYRRGSGGRASCVKGKSGKWEVEDYQAFGPQIIAGIQLEDLPNNLLSRGFWIEMRLKEKEERRDKWRIAHKEYLKEFHAKIARWTKDNQANIASCVPAMDGLDNRIEDNFEPLFRIATVADGEDGAWLRALKRIAKKQDLNMKSIKATLEC